MESLLTGGNAMMKFPNLMRVTLLLSILSLSCPAIWARTQSSTPPKKTKAANESCDGALDIVPSKPMTFARKRRPSNGETKQSAPDAKGSTKDAKPEKQSSGGSR